MASESKVIVLAYTVCGHTIETKTKLKTKSQPLKKSRAFLSRRKSPEPTRIQTGYGWCPVCIDYYGSGICSPYCILNFWKYKHDHGMFGAVPQASVRGTILFDTTTVPENILDGSAAANDMAGFLQAIGYTPAPAEVHGMRELGFSYADAQLAVRYRFAARMRRATLDWAAAECQKTLAQTKARIATAVELHIPILSLVPQHPKRGAEYPVLFDPSTRSCVFPISRSASPLPSQIARPAMQPATEHSQGAGASTLAVPDVLSQEIYFRVKHDLESPSLVQICPDNGSDRIRSSKRRKVGLSIDTSTSSTSCPRNPPPRPSLRLAACSQHGRTAVAHDCEKCKRIHFEEIAIPPTLVSGWECKSPPLSRSNEHISCTQALCYCKEVGRDHCPTCPLRAKSEAEGTTWI